MTSCSNDALNLRITSCETREVRPFEIPTMKANIAYQRHDVYYLKCVDFNDTMRMVEDEGAPATSDIPTNTTGMYRVEMQYIELQMQRLMRT